MRLPIPCQPSGLVPPAADSPRLANHLPRWWVVLTQPHTLPALLQVLAFKATVKKVNTDAAAVASPAVKEAKAEGGGGAHPGGSCTT